MVLKITALIAHHPTKAIMVALEISHRMEIKMQTKCHKMKVVPTTEKNPVIISNSIAKKIERWRLNKRMKSVVAVKSVSGTTTKGMKPHVRGCLEGNSLIQLSFISEPIT